MFVFSALAAARIPSRKSLRSAWRTSQISNVSALWFKITGYVGFLVGGSMVLAYLIVPNLGLTGNVPYAVVLFVIVISYLLMVYASAKNPLVGKSFRDE